MNELFRYISAAAIFAVIDLAWLGLVANKFYRAQLGFLLRKKPEPISAAVFYLLFIAGLTYFVIDPSLSQSSAASALFRGAAFGLITYATYDLTNLSTIKDWPLRLTLVDLAWGTMLSALVSGITFVLLHR